MRKRIITLLAIFLFITGCGKENIIVKEENQVMSNEADIYDDYVSDSSDLSIDLYDGELTISHFNKNNRIYLEASDEIKKEDTIIVTALDGNAFDYEIECDKVCTIQFNDDSFVEGARYRIQVVPPFTYFGLDTPYFNEKTILVEMEKKDVFNLELKENAFLEPYIKNKNSKVEVLNDQIILKTYYSYEVGQSVGYLDDQENLYKAVLIQNILKDSEDNGYNEYVVDLIEYLNLFNDINVYGKTDIEILDVEFNEDFDEALIKDNKDSIINFLEKIGAITVVNATTIDQTDFKVKKSYQKTDNGIRLDVNIIYSNNNCNFSFGFNLDIEPSVEANIQNFSLKNFKFTQKEVLTPNLTVSISDTEADEGDLKELSDLIEYYLDSDPIPLKISDENVSLCTIKLASSGIMNIALEIALELSAEVAKGYISASMPIENKRLFEIREEKGSFKAYTDKSSIHHPLHIEAGVEIDTKEVFSEAIVVSFFTNNIANAKLKNSNGFYQTIEGYGIVDVNGLGDYKILDKEAKMVLDSGYIWSLAFTIDTIASKEKTLFEHTFKKESFRGFPMEIEYGLQYEPLVVEEPLVIYKTSNLPELKYTTTNKDGELEEHTLGNNAIYSFVGESAKYAKIVYDSDNKPRIVIDKDMPSNTLLLNARINGEDLQYNLNIEVSNEIPTDYNNIYWYREGDTLHLTSAIPDDEHEYNLFQDGVIYTDNYRFSTFKDSIKTIVIDTKIYPKSLYKSFIGFKNLTHIVKFENIMPDYLNVNGEANFSLLFQNCYSLISVDLSSLGDLKVDHMYQMFKGCRSLKSVNLGTIDTSNATSFAEMFMSCSSITSIDVSNLNTSSLNSTYMMFAYCTNLEDAKMFSVKKGQDVNTFFMFTDCPKLQSKGISWVSIDLEE